VATDYFTDAETDTEVRVLRLEERSTRARPEGDEEDWSVWHGEVHVTTVATLYKKIRFYTRENVGAEDIHLPPEELDTEAFVLTVSGATAAAVGLVSGSRAAAWRGVGRLLRRVAPLYLRCQPGDLGLSTEIRSRHFRVPAIFLYDRVPGSVGLGGALYRDHADVVRAALEVVRRCECTQGCPACVGTVEEVGALGKETACEVLEHLASAGPLRAADVPPAAAEEG